MTKTRTQKTAARSPFAASITSSLIAIMLSIVLCMSQIGVPFSAYAVEGNAEQTTTSEVVADEETQSADEQARPADEEASGKGESFGNEATNDIEASEFAPVGESASSVLVPAEDPASKQFAPIARDASANAANLVLIVELTDSSADSYYNQQYEYTGSKYRTNLDYLNDQLNASPSIAFQQSYRSYLNIISKGKFNVASYIPQMYEDGTFLPIRVNMSSSQVENNGVSFNSSLLVTEAVTQLKAARPDLDASIFDVNADGVIDNVLIIVDLPSEVSVTSHASSYGGDIRLGTSGNQKLVRTYTVLNGGVSGLITKFNPSVAVHERLHTLGARDYYRRGAGNEDSENGTGVNNPVGMWDVMAQGSSYAWPLAFTRQQVGWITIPELSLGTASKTVTLYAPADSDDNPSSKPQSYAIKLPTSSSEYFVIEYREKGRHLGESDYEKTPLDTTPLYDRHISASGLIVYRVNESLADEGNIGGKDYVYVFRPGETSLTASAGNIDRAPIAAGSYTTQGSVTLNSSIGSLDANAQITDGAICYSDGRNSGLKVTAKAQTDNSITVTIEQAPIDASTTWMPVLSANGSSPFSGFSATRTRVTNDGTNTYVLAEDQRGGYQRWSVCKYDGSSWTTLGAAQSNIVNADIAWYNGALYAIEFCPSESSARLKRFNGSSWTTVSTVAKGISYGDTGLFVVGGKLYAMVSTGGTVSVYDCSSSKFVAYGPDLPTSAATAPTLVDVGGQLAVIAGDTTSEWKTNLYVLSGGSWKATTLPSVKAAATVCSAKIGSHTYVYVFANPSYSYLYEVDAAGQVTRSTEVSQGTSGVLGASLSSDGTDLYLTLGSNSKGTVTYKFPNGQTGGMSQVDGAVYATGTNGESTIVGNKLLVAITDTASNVVVVRSHGVVPTPSTPVEPEKATVSISFDANGGTGVPAKLSGKAGSAIASTWPTAVPVRGGYVFAGWYTDKADGKGTKVTAYPKTFPIVNVTYYAHWVKQQGTSSSSNSGNTSNSNNSSSSNNSSNSSNSGASVAVKAPAVTGKWIRSGSRWWFQYDAATKASQKKSWPASEWVTIGGTRYHFNSGGWMHTGWQWLDNSWYYFGGTHDGAMKTGWKKVGGKWYFMEKSTGKMKTGWLDDGGARYYLRSSGAMALGWLSLSGKWYYLNSSGAMVKNRWISGKYWVGSDGVMATSSWVDNNRYYVNASGAWVPNARR